MKPDRWREVDELFAAVLEREPQDRAAFLGKACGNDRDLRREVEQMLNFDKQAADFIETDVFEEAARLITQPQEVLPKPVDSSPRQAVKKSTSSITSHSIDDAR